MGLLLHPGNRCSEPNECPVCCPGRLDYWWDEETCELHWLGNEYVTQVDLILPASISVAETEYLDIGVSGSLYTHEDEDYQFRYTDIDGCVQLSSVFTAGSCCVTRTIDNCHCLTEFNSIRHLDTVVKVVISGAVINRPGLYSSLLPPGDFNGTFLVDSYNTTFIFNETLDPPGAYRWDSILQISSCPRETTTGGYNHIFVYMYSYFTPSSGTNFYNEYETWFRWPTVIGNIDRSNDIDNCPNLTPATMLGFMCPSLGSLYQSAAAAFKGHINHIGPEDGFPAPDQHAVNDVWDFSGVTVTAELI